VERKAKADAEAAERRAFVEGLKVESANPKDDFDWVCTHPLHVDGKSAKVTLADLRDCPSRRAATMLVKAVQSPTDFKNFFEQNMKMLLAEKKVKDAAEDEGDVDPSLEDLKRMLKEATK
jgi:hypothetical protein